MRFNENNITYNYHTKASININVIDSISPISIIHFEKHCDELTFILGKSLIKINEFVKIERYGYLKSKDSETNRRISESNFYYEYPDFSFMTPYGIVTFIHEYVESSLSAHFNLRVIYDGKPSDFNKIIDSVKNFYGENYGSIVKGYRQKTLNDDNNYQLYLESKKQKQKQQFIVI